MELLNATKMQADYTLGFEADGRELLIVAVKGTFEIPPPGREAQLAEVQEPLVSADVFTCEPGRSAILYEVDFAHRKPACDVLLNGSAYAPGGKPVERTTVSLQVDSLSKSFEVVGNRRWLAGSLSLAESHPEDFTVMPISYDNAFGGVAAVDGDPDKLRWYPTNHAGVGYHEHLSAKAVDGKPLPNTQESGKSITRPNGSYKPMAFGAIGRSWQPRARWAGTYDQPWLDNRAPFWPDDFHYRYFQAAPEDQQIPHPKGGEEVTLKNLSPRGLEQFRLPQLPMPVLFVMARGDDFVTRGVLDTILFEPDASRFILTWRVAHPLRCDIFDVNRVIVGEKRLPSSTFKRRYANLGALVRAKRGLADVGQN
jgi:hypothetical protein